MEFWDTGLGLWFSNTPPLHYCNTPESKRLEASPEPGMWLLFSFDILLFDIHYSVFHWVV